MAQRCLFKGFGKGEKIISHRHYLITGVSFSSLAQQAFLQPGLQVFSAFLEHPFFVQPSFLQAFFFPFPFNISFCSALRDALRWTI